MRSEVTQFVFNYPTHAVVWTVYCGDPQPKLDHYVTPDGRGLQIHCDYRNTLASAQNYVMEYEEYFSPETFAPLEVWHMYEKASDEHYATFYDGR